MLSQKHRILFIFCAVLLPAIALWHLFAGDILLSFNDLFYSFTNYDSSNTGHIIMRDFRLPRMTMAILSGAGLSVAGLLMQNLFNNPLAGPNILGISTGSSLFVAISVMTGISIFSTDFGILASALIGALVFGGIILFFSFFAKSHTSLLLIGIMIGSFSSAFVSIIQTYSDSQELKVFVMWAMGSLQQVTFEQLPIIILFLVGGFLICFALTRSLNALALGSDNASVLGVNVKQVRLVIIIVTALLTGVITAFCGPIAFIGLAVPNLTKILFKTQSHLTLIIGCIFIGSIFMLLCDIIIQLLDSYIHLPINALTSLIGAPFVILIILKKLT